MTDQEKQQQQLWSEIIIEGYGIDTKNLGYKCKTNVVNISHAFTV